MIKIHKIICPGCGNIHFSNECPICKYMVDRSKYLSHTIQVSKHIFGNVFNCPLCDFNIIFSPETNNTEDFVFLLKVLKHFVEIHKARISNDIEVIISKELKEIPIELIGTKIIKAVKNEKVEKQEKTEKNQEIKMEN